MSLLLKKLNQASAAQQAADEDAAKQAAEQEGAQAQPGQPAQPSAADPAAAPGAPGGATLKTATPQPSTPAAAAAQPAAAPTPAAQPATPAAQPAAAAPTPASTAAPKPSPAAAPTTPPTPAPTAAPTSPPPAQPSPAAAKPTEPYIAKPAAPAAAPTPAAPAPTPAAAPALKTAAPTSAPATPAAPTPAPAAPVAPAPALKTTPPPAPAPAAAPALKTAAPTPTPAPAAAPTPPPTPAPAAAPSGAEVQLGTASTIAADIATKKISDDPEDAKKRKLAPSLRPADYFRRARGVVSAARIFGAQSSESSGQWKFLAGMATVFIATIGSLLYAYVYAPAQVGVEAAAITAETGEGEGGADSGRVAAVVALPLPQVDVQAQVAQITVEKVVVVDETIITDGTEVINDYAIVTDAEIVPDVEYSEEEWSLIQREEREAAEEEASDLASIAATEPVGAEEEAELSNQIKDIRVPDKDISIGIDDNVTANRAAIQSSERAERRGIKLARAADLYSAGRYDLADRLYAEVLSEAPKNLQALRGSALSASAMRRYKSAAGFYVRILEHFPDDPFAVAELANLGGINPAEVERTLKSLLGKVPDIDGRLYFALGNVYAASQRWQNARDAFGDALSREKNPDYAYNLAVALEYLRKPDLAAHYYKQALQMARGSATAGFDADTVRARIVALDA